MSKDKNQRKTVEIARKRIPLRKLIHGKEIREAAQALESFRLKFKEEEFLYGGRIHVKWDSYGDAEAVVTRPETDKEFSDRLEKERLAAERKAQREQQRKIAAYQRAIYEAETRRQRTVNTIKEMARENGLTADDIKSILE